MNIREQELRRRVAQIKAARAEETRCPSRAMTPVIGKHPGGMWKHCIRTKGHPDAELHMWVEAFEVVSRRPVLMTWEGPYSRTPTISTVLIGVAPIPRHTPGKEPGHHD